MFEGRLRLLLLLCCVAAAIPLPPLGPSAICFDYGNDIALVDISTLSRLLVRWGPCPFCRADADRSGEVDIADVAALLLAWGPQEDLNSDGMADSCERAYVQHARHIEFRMAAFIGLPNTRQSFVNRRATGMSFVEIDTAVCADDVPIVWHGTEREGDDPLAAWDWEQPCSERVNTLRNTSVEIMSVCDTVTTLEELLLNVQPQFEWVFLDLKGFEAKHGEHAERLRPIIDVLLRTDYGDRSHVQVLSYQRPAVELMRRHRIAWLYKSAGIPDTMGDLVYWPNGFQRSWTGSPNHLNCWDDRTDEYFDMLFYFGRGSEGITALEDYSERCHVNAGFFSHATQFPGSPFCSSGFRFNGTTC